MASAVAAATSAEINGSETESKRSLPNLYGRSSFPQRFGFFLFQCVRWGVIHGGLTLIFALWLSIYIIKVVHDDYFLALVHRARRTDTDLLHEYTYYNRQCNVADLTATTPQEATDLIISPTTPTSVAIHKLMRHGAVMVPSILNDETIQKLRRFVVAKNAAVRGTPAEFPVSQGRHRISYGIEATEDDAVVEALREIHDHPSLRRILQQTTGDLDPSLTEITAITAYYQCSHQAWHSDVKADGNGVKFGRTYSHSYSLFIPLQDTSERMGPTDLCAGTHYCGDEYLWEICEEHKIGLHQIAGARGNVTMDRMGVTNSNEVWRAGDGFLLNQQVWHRGSAHRDKRAPERIVFIVSFLGRPHQQDHVRQLSRGTYFHMKYNMWGHSFSDLRDSARWMGRPWNLLRCLHLWKPHDRNFGYDLFTSAAMRIGNNQLGCEPGDLARFLQVMDRIGIFPKFLDGAIDLEHPEAWQMYFRETIHNYLHFFRNLNLVGLSAYTLIIFFMALRKRGSRSGVATPPKTGANNPTGSWILLYDGFRPLFKSHGLVFIWAMYTLYTIHSSPWARDIASGKTLMRPFPNGTDPAALSNEFAWRNHQNDEDSKLRRGVERGLTTFPRRLDVLVGTRMNSRTIGSYASWFDFHPGNFELGEYVKQFGGRPFRRLLRLEAGAALQSTRIENEKKLDPVPVTRLIHQAAIAFVERRDARFLIQDYSTGDWLVMTPRQRDDYVQLILIVGSSSLLAALKQELDFLLDKYRFGFRLRDFGAMKRLSLAHLQDMSAAMFAVPGHTTNRIAPAQSVPDSVTTRPSRRPAGAWRISTAGSTHTFPDTVTKLDRRKLQKKAFYLLQEVTYISPENEQQEDVTIIGLSTTGKQNNGRSGRATFDIAFYGIASEEMGSVLRFVSGDDLVNHPPLTEGNRVYADYDNRGQYFPGVATRVLPNDNIHVTYEDGDVEYFVPSTRYGVPFE